MKAFSIPNELQKPNTYKLEINEVSIIIMQKYVKPKRIYRSISPRWTQ